MKRVFQAVPGGSSNSTPTHMSAVKRLRFTRLVALFMLALIAIPALPLSLAQALTVETDEPTYSLGEEIEISGTAGVEVNVTILVSHNSDAIFNFTVTSEEDGSYSTSVQLAENASDGLYTVTASAGAESAQTSFTVTDPAQEELAENLISQAEDSKDNVEEVFELLIEFNITIPPGADESYNLGSAAWVRAQTLYDEGDYTGAAEAAYQSMGHFGDAFQLAQGSMPLEAEEEDESEEPEDNEELVVTIERAYAYWEKLNATVFRLDEEGYNVVEIIDILNEAKEKLDNATTLIDDNFTAAVRELLSARRVLGRIHGYLQSRIKEHKERQAEQFLEQFRNRIQKINGTLERLQERLEEGSTLRVRNKLIAALRKLDQIRERLRSGDAEEALDDLEDVVEEIEKSLDELNGEGFSVKLKSMNRMEAKIQVLTKTAERLARKGRNMSAIEEELEEANDFLNEVRENLEEGNTEAAGELLEEAQGIFDELKEELRTSKKEEINQKILEKIREKLSPDDNEED